MLFHVALGMTLRANPASRVPFYRNAAIIPGGSVAMRVIGAGLIVLGVVLLSTSAWYWPFIVVLAGPVAALTVITIHNRKVTNQLAEHKASAQ
ncbi:hypothetical protein LZG07_03820 [Microbacterium profundi]|uniref:hypothetical protein n=1 Tax=Microbacterium profundi TaxID=450380 RepID=UPI0019CFC52B|nr:hypothetical protein [Microbacterium profundi]MCE7481059.1 hypothetical protein [Microbacterium profundi]